MRGKKEKLSQTFGGTHKVFIAFDGTSGKKQEYHSNKWHLCRERRQGHGLRDSEYKPRLRSIYHIVYNDKQNGIDAFAHLCNTVLVPKDIEEGHQCCNTAQKGKQVAKPLSAGLGFGAERINAET